MLLILPRTAPSWSLTNAVNIEVPAWVGVPVRKIGEVGVIASALTPLLRPNRVISVDLAGELRTKLRPGGSKPLTTVTEVGALLAMRIG